MKNECLPWNFQPNELEAKFIVFYGQNLAMSLSLSRHKIPNLSNFEFTKSLYSEDLFNENIGLRFMGGIKEYEYLLKKNKDNVFSRQCILVVDGKITKKDSDCVYVKCDEMNFKSRKLFIQFWNKILETDLPEDLEINNLDEFKMAVTLKKLGIDPQIYHFSETSCIWSSLRSEQFKNQKLFQGIYKHFEMWARNNIPHDEALRLGYHKVKFELERFKNQS